MIKRKKIGQISLLLGLIFSFCLSGCKNSNDESSGSNSPKNEFTVTWQNYDGTILEIDENVKKGTMPEYNGATPTRLATKQVTFVFDGWSPTLQSVSYDCTYVAKYSQKLNEFNITWQNYDGTVLKTDSNVKFGELPEYNGETPIKEGNKQYSYIFEGWTPDISIAKEDATYKARFRESINKYDVIWKNYDGTVLETDKNIEYGTIPTYNSSFPTRENDNKAHYTFKGWDKEIGPVHDDIEYIAEFDADTTEYTIRWENYDGTLLKEDKCHYLDLPSYDGTLPSRESNEKYNYEFNGWSPKINKVTNNVTYTAQFDSNIKTFTVTYKNYDGSILYVDKNIEYGSISNYVGETPLGPTSNTEKYTFIGWDKNANEVKADLILTAQFSKETRKYDITWKLDDETIIRTDHLAYGDTPYFGDNNPTKPETDQYIYTFTGWSPSINSVNANATYTACFSKEVKSYDIVWKNFDGTILKSEKLPYGHIPEYDETNPSMPNDKYVYTFTGWSPSISKVTKNQTYIAQYNIALNEKILITYEAKGAENVPESIYKKGGESIRISNVTPNKPGFVFMGWNSIHEDKIYKPNQLFYGDFDVKFIALWAKTCSKCNGNGVIETNQQCDSCYGKGYILPEAPTILDIDYNSITLRQESGFEYSMDGEIWQTSNTFNNLMPSQNYTFYSRKATIGSDPFGLTSFPLEVSTISIPIYKIKYNTNGGVEPNIKSYTPEDEIVISRSSKVGHTFVGWTDDLTDVPVLDYVIKKGTRGDINLVAHWKVNKYKIEFDTNGGKDISPIVLDYNSKINLPTAEKVNKTFDGWYDKALTKKFDLEFMPDENITLYAKYTEYEVNITSNYTNIISFENGLNPDKSDVKAIDTDGNELTPTISVIKGEFLPANYVDILISVEGKFGIEFTKKVEHLLVLEESQSLLHLYKDDKEIDSIIIKNGENTSLPIYKGYNTYWYLNDTCLTNLDGNLIKPWNMKSNEYDLICKTEEIEYLIEYELNGGKNSDLNPSTYNINSENINITTPSKVGYTFDGWKNVKTGEISSNVIIAKGSIGNRKFEAVWEANKYNVSIDNNGGTPNSGCFEATYDSSVILQKPTKTGYTFDGYYFDNKKVDLSCWKIASDCTLVARWKANSNTKYIVNHYTQDLNTNAYNIKETETLFGVTDSIIVPETKKYNGYVIPETQTVTILPDGTTVVEYYYARGRYELTVVKNDGQQNEIYQFLYGQSLESIQCQRNGYTFGGLYFDENLNNKAKVMADKDTNVYVWWSNENKAGDFDFINNEDGTTVKLVKYKGQNNDVVVPSYIGGKSVSIIGKDTFNGCIIPKLIIPKTIQLMENQCLFGIKGLVDLTLPFIGKSRDNREYFDESLGYLFLYDYSDEYQSTLQTLTITDANYIGELIYGKQTITTVNLNNSINTIGADAFCGFTSLITINLPASLKIIGERSFNGCTNLTDIVIPNGVTNIENDAFNGTNISNIVFLGSLIYIGDNAFANTKLTELIIPSNVNEIGSGAFKNCPLTSITLNEGIKIIGSHAFENSKVDTAIIPNSVTKIGYSLYYGNENLVSAVIPFLGHTRTEACSIYDYFYSDLSSLRTLTITGGTSICDYAFKGYKSSLSVYFADTITNMGAGVFMDCAELDTVVLPEPLKFISRQAFMNSCIKTLIIKENVAAIFGYAFANTTGLTELIVPKSLTDVCSYAFYECGIKRIAFQEGLNYIGSYAFRRSNIEEIVVPNSVELIEGGAFLESNVVNLTLPFVGRSIDAVGRHKTLGYLFVELYRDDWKQDPTINTSNNGYVSRSLHTLTITREKELVYHEFSGCRAIVHINLNNEITTISENTFSSCTWLTTVNIPTSTKTIGRSAFCECKHLETITLNNNITRIEDNTFSGSGIKSIYIPESVRYIGECAFEETPNLQEITIPKGIEEIPFRCFRKSGLTSITLNNDLKYIRKEAFYGNKLTSIIVPNSVILIESYAFEFSKQLKSVTLPFIGNDEGNAKYDVFGEIFGNARGLAGQVPSGDCSYLMPTTIETVTITKEKVIVCRAFEHLDFIKTINLNDNVEIIEDEAFANCTGLSLINIPSKLKTIGAKAFYLCKSLTGELILPEAVTRIEDYTFKSCGFSKVILSANTTYIGAESFANTLNLIDINIPSDIITLHYSAFWNSKFIPQV